MMRLMEKVMMEREEKGGLASGGDATMVVVVVVVAVLGAQKEDQRERKATSLPEDGRDGVLMADERVAHAYTQRRRG